MSPSLPHDCLVFRFVIALGLALAGSAQAQNEPFVVVPVPFAAQSPTVPYDAVDGEAFSLPAVARGVCAQAIQYRWDVDGDGTYDTALLNAPNRWSLGHTYTWPRQASSRVFTTRIEARCGEAVSTATLPVRVNVNPSTGMRVNKAIARALWWAHSQLSRDANLQTAGWSGVGASYEVAAAAELAHAFSVLGHGGSVNPAADPYAEDARWLVNFVLNRMTRINIAAGSDINGNGYGLKFNGCTANNAHYCGGSGLSGLASFGDFNGLVPANIGIPEVRGRALLDVVRDASEYFYSIIKQNGGWDYPSGGQFNIDTSQTGWVATGLLEARINAGVVHPQSVRDRLYTGIQWNASGATGWWGYRHRTDCAPGNLARSGGGLVTLALILDRTADGAAPNGARNYVQPTVNYIGANFELDAIGANDGNCFIEQLEVSEIDRHFGNYYAMYQVAKSLRAFTSAYPTVPNPAGAVDWATRYSTYFIGAQSPDGQFNSDAVWLPNFPQMATPLALLVLSPSPFQALPVAVARADLAQAAPGEDVTFDHSASFARDAASHFPVEFPGLPDGLRREWRRRHERSGGLSPRGRERRRSSDGRRDPLGLPDRRCAGPPDLALSAGRRCGRRQHPGAPRGRGQPRPQGRGRRLPPHPRRADQPPARRARTSLG